MAECLSCKQVKMNLVKLGEESQDAIRELMTMTGTLKAEIERLKQANENNLEGWRQNVAGLQREIERLRKRLEAAEQCILAPVRNLRGHQFRLCEYCGCTFAPDADTADPENHHKECSWAKWRVLAKEADDG